MFDFILRHKIRKQIKELYDSILSMSDENIVELLIMAHDLRRKIRQDTPVFHQILLFPEEHDDKTRFFWYKLLVKIAFQQEKLGKKVVNNAKRIGLSGDFSAKQAFIITNSVMLWALSIVGVSGYIFEMRQIWDKIYEVESKLDGILISINEKNIAVGINELDNNFIDSFKEDFMIIPYIYIR